MGGAKRSPMPQTRKMTKIDIVFNKFLDILNSQEKSLKQNLRYKLKVTKNEKEVFRLLREGWSLLQIVDGEFVIRKAQRRNPNVYQPLRLRGRMIREADTHRLNDFNHK